MRTLVTGSAGFVGRHMVAELLARGWDVTGCDLRDGGDCREVFLADGTCYDLVVHCAYHVGGRRAIDGEPLLLAKNLELDAAMFDWAVRSGQRAVLYFSSSAAYPVQFQQGERILEQPAGSPLPNFRLPPRVLCESDIDLSYVRQPDARYGWAKLTGERLAAAASECGLRVHVVRPFSGYGEDQDDCYPFPAIVQRALNGDLTVWGPPGQHRDWIHVDDVVRGALAVVDADERRPVNLCSGRPTEFGDLAELVWVMAHDGAKTHYDIERPVSSTPSRCTPKAQVRYDVDRPTGVMYRVGDPARMREHYTPTVTLDEGIRRALEYIRGGRA